MKAIPVYGHQTALRDTAVLATSGPKFASLCCIRGRCAPNSARKVPMDWRFSNDVTVPRVCLVKYGKMRPPLLNQDFMCARRSE